MNYAIRGIVFGSVIIFGALFPACMVMAGSYNYGHGHHNYRSHTYYGSQRQHEYYQSDCHPVHKYTYDNYGYRAKIGGTMCYDEYGQAYVVPGSRYLIHHD